MGDILKVEFINDELINIFINRKMLSDINYDEDLVGVIDKLVYRIDEIYKVGLCGFYKINCYINEKLGIFLDIIKIDDNEFSNTTDFRILLNNNSKFLLEVDLTNIVDNIPIRVYDGNFYISVDNIESIDKYIDNCRVVYGNEADTIIKNSKLLNKKEVTL